MVSSPKVGDIIRMRSWHGVVLDVFKNEAGKTILRVQTARNVFRRLNPEFIELDLAPDTIEAATINDLQAEIESYQQFLNRSITELIECSQHHEQGEGKVAAANAN
ncbi:MAG: hypothetical protein U0175_14760 [Caldilineaceae bacterium]